MSRRGDNIHKRSDGRWEGRCISGRSDEGKAIYKSVYARSYAECSEKLKLARCGLLSTSRPITVAELYRAWLLGRKNTIKQSTYSSYTNLFESYISDPFGEKRVESLNAFMLNRFSDELLHSGGKSGQGLSAVTVQAVMILLRSVLEYGAKEYELPNPAKNISLPKAENAEITLFTPFEATRIKAAALRSDNYDLGILLTLYTGLRIGELCALTWGNIDLTGQIIHINKTLFRIANPQQTAPKTVVVIDSPKSKSSVRVVPLPTFMLTALARLKRGQPDSNYFLTCSQGYTEPRSYALRYRTFLKRLNIPYRKFHSLRHTYATECIKCGVDVKSLSELLGHSSVKITLERYVHSDMELKKRELEKLWSAL
ncbi:Site-specific recombinase XerD [Ruminococcaceae bacterium FB2012]|nr:Site-specific recombinase XerD [Ruminococcaceae bacterium FB2012]